MGFPTTVHPIIQNDMRPVVVDIDLETDHVKVDRSREAVGQKTRVIMKQVESFWDWAHDRYCKDGQEDTCNKDFGRMLRGLP